MAKYSQVSQVTFTTPKKHFVFCTWPIVKNQISPLDRNIFGK